MRRISTRGLRLSSRKWMICLAVAGALIALRSMPPRHLSRAEPEDLGTNVPPLSIGGREAAAEAVPLEEE